MGEGRAGGGRSRFGGEGRARGGRSPAAEPRLPLRRSAPVTARARAAPEVRGGRVLLPGDGGGGVGRGVELRRRPSGTDGAPGRRKRGGHRPRDGGWLLSPAVGREGSGRPRGAPCGPARREPRAGPAAGHFCLPVRSAGAAGSGVR